MARWLREHVAFAEDTIDPQHPQNSSPSPTSLIQFQNIQYATHGIYTQKKLAYSQSKVNNLITFKDGRLRRELTAF